VVQWRDFARAAPELAALGEERLRRQELCLVGTLRKNGYPRISPCEPDFAAGHLLLGMMWRSPKALDLLRDPRCVVHSCTSDRRGTEGDFKLYGEATNVRDPQLRAEYREAIEARIGWAPDEPNYHLFALDIASAGFVIFGDERYVLAWDPAGGLRRRELRRD
jgi:hypothetical protein